MSDNHISQTSHFYDSVKIWWVILFSISLIALFVFSVAFLVQHYQTDDYWNASSAVLAFLGVMLTAGAAIPAISAILSYLGFIEKHQQAEKQLQHIGEKLNAFSAEFEKLPDIQTLILEKESEKRFLDYLRNPTDSTHHQWIEQAIKKEQSSYYLTLLANAAGSLYWFYSEIETEQTQYYFPVLKHRIDLIDHYRQLAMVDTLFIERYLLHLSEMLNEFIRALNYQDDEHISFYQSFIYDWVLDLIAFDEMPLNRTEMTQDSIINPILSLYHSGFLNSDMFRNDVKARITFHHRKEARISKKLGITKTLFTKTDTL